MSELPASRSGWTLAAIDHVLDDGTLEDGRRLLRDVTADATLAGWVVWLVQRREQLGVVSGFDRIIGWKVLELFPLLADRVVEDRARAAARAVWRMVGQPASRPGDEADHRRHDRKEELPAECVRELVRRSLASVDPSRGNLTAPGRSDPAAGRGPDGRGGSHPRVRSRRCGTNRSGGPHGLAQRSA